MLSLVLLLASCTEKKVYKIGVAQCSKGPWREKVNREMLAAQHLYEHDVKVSIPGFLRQVFLLSALIVKPVQTILLLLVAIMLRLVLSWVNILPQ